MSLYKMAQDFEEAFNQFGYSTLDDDFAAQLLAFCYVVGSEVCVLNQGLNCAIARAQQKFKILGSETPDPKGVSLIQKYIKELLQINHIQDGSVGVDGKPMWYKCMWVKNIYDRFQITYDPKDFIPPPLTLF